MATHRPDLVILGSGPAGASAAVFLQQLDPGLASRAVLLERRHHPRDKGCGGGLTGRCGPLLERMGLGANPTDAPEVQRIRLSHGERVTHLELAIRIPVVRRHEFDAALAARAREAVGGFHEDEPARQLRRDGDRVEVVTDRGVYATRLVIDASGSRCVSRRSGLLPRGREPVPVWIADGPPAPGEAGLDGEPALRFDFSEMAHGCPGYYWAFPTRDRGEPLVSRGFYPAAGLPAVRAREALERRLVAHGVDPAAVPFQAWPARLFEVGTVTCAPGVLAAGDAAGVDPVLGEGISQSLEYGLLAARAAVRAFRRRRFDLSGSYLPRAGLGGRLTYMARMQDEIYVPDYERRLAYALDCSLLQRLIWADSHGSVPAPLLWAGAALLGMFYRRFADLELHTPREKTVRL
jgi:menaquinone-9 beta-reductase